MEKYEREARLNIPKGYYVLGRSETVKPSDLLWSWTSKEWLRADSPEWKFQILEVENLVCAVRKPEMSDFEKSVPKQRIFRF